MAQRPTPRQVLEFLMEQRGLRPAADRHVPDKTVQYLLYLNADPAAFIGDHVGFVVGNWRDLDYQEDYRVAWDKVSDRGFPVHPLKGARVFAARGANAIRSKFGLADPARLARCAEAAALPPTAPYGSPQSLTRQVSDWLYQSSRIVDLWCCPTCRHFFLADHGRQGYCSPACWPAERRSRAADARDRRARLREERERQREAAEVRRIEKLLADADARRRRHSHL